MAEFPFAFSVGQLVISKQGKDTGMLYVVAGEANGRVMLILPPKYNTTHPKAKNPKHLQPCSRRAEKLIAKIEAGQDIDAGYFHRSVVN